MIVLIILPTESKAALKETEPVTNVMKNPSKVVVLRVSLSHYYQNNGIIDVGL